MTKRVEIRRAAASDVDGLLGCDVIAAERSSRAAFIRRAVRANQCFVAADDGRVVAYAVLEYSFYGNGLLSMLWVSEPSRRRGIGTALVRRVERECLTPKLFTSTNQSNAAMRALLAKLGYEASGVIENLDEGDSELVFVKRVGAVGG